jgi:imidazolonepropionase-like amidohydrolase
VIENGIVKEVGRRGPAPPGAVVVNAAGKWAIPGLIDAHVHFDQSAGIYARPDIVDLRLRRSYASEVAGVRERLDDTLARYTASGVTGVVDMGGPMWTFDLRDRAAAMRGAPRVAVSGPLLATHRVPELETADPPLIVMTSPVRARELARRIAGRRPDLVKILWEVKAVDSLAEQSEIVRAAIEESHRAGIRVAAHALELETAKAALRAGADILVHSVEDAPIDAEFIAMMKARDVIYIPTLAVVGNYFKVLGKPGKAPDLTDIERRLGDPLAIESWSELASIPFEQMGNIPYFPPPEKRSPMSGNLRRLRDAGVRIAAGTDAGNIGTLHGPAIHREFELMADAGMKPEEILVAATRNGAAVMGRADAGVIAEGMAADIVLLDADPTSSVKNLRKIYKVMKAGAFIE